jgi:hypothetical protein
LMAVGAPLLGALFSTSVYWLFFASWV